MGEIPNSRGLVAACGLYCGACHSYQKGSCPGCGKRERPGWCKIRHCVHKQDYHTCAQCAYYNDPAECNHFNSFIANAIGLLLNSDRCACILKIRALGLDDYATYMSIRGIHAIPRRGKID